MFLRIIETNKKLAKVDKVPAPADALRPKAMCPEELARDAAVLKAAEVFNDLKLAYEKLQDRIATLFLLANSDKIDQPLNINAYWKLFAGIVSMAPLLGNNPDPLWHAIAHSVAKLNKFFQEYTEVQIAESSHQELFFSAREEFYKLLRVNSFEGAEEIIQKLYTEVDRIIKEKNILSSLFPLLVFDEKNHQIVDFKFFKGFAGFLNKLTALLSDNKKLFGSYSEYLTQIEKQSKSEIMAEEQYHNTVKFYQNFLSSLEVVKLLQAELWGHRGFLYTLGLERFFEEADEILREQHNFLKTNSAKLLDWQLLNKPLKKGGVSAVRFGR